MRRFMTLLAIAVSIASCKDKASKESNVRVAAAEQSTYRLDQPRKSWAMQPDLLEISGITWAGNNQLLAIEDATANIYIIGLNGEAAVRHKAPLDVEAKKKLDLEDVTLVGNTAYALRSNGELIEIKNWQDRPATRLIETGIPDGENIEGLCYDPKTGNLLLAMKDARGKKGKKAGGDRIVYAYDIKSGSLLTEPFLDIGKTERAEMGRGKFNPSAIAVHPQTGDIYVLGSAGDKGLACFDRKGALKSFTPIADEQMLQPEGLCFAPDGTLYISSEGLGNKPAQLYQFAAPR